MTDILELKRLNTVKVSAVFDRNFRTYGRVLTGYDFSEMTDWLENTTDIPAEGNVYVASVEALEQTAVFAAVERAFYGEMPAQAGYCNGRNSTLNGFEYHKGSEINVAATDLTLLLGHTWDIAADNTYKGAQAEAFFVPRGTAVELYETTLHLSPCKVYDSGFKTVVILPKGTNTPLEEEKQAYERRDALLLMKNKWVIAHPERVQLTRQGAFAGVIGENYEFKYK
ncbi:MAG: DUF4867 family protein [Clostridia bacterium]|nr:DUF4867 family protein [Clostridia bacterium]